MRVKDKVMKFRDICPPPRRKYPPKASEKRANTIINKKLRLP